VSNSIEGYNELGLLTLGDAMTVEKEKEKKTRTTKQN